MNARLLVLLGALLVVPGAPAGAQDRAPRELRIPAAFRGRAPPRGRELRVPRGFEVRTSPAERVRARRAELRTPASWRR